MTLWRMLMGLSAVILAGVIATFAMLQPKQVNALGCRADGILNQHTIVLIDQSDPFTEQDVNWAKSIVRDESRHLRKYGRITILGLISDSPYEPEEVFSRCSPGSHANGWIDNPRMIEDRFEQDVATPISVAIEQLLSQKEQESSPLIEALVGISDRSDFSPNVKTRRVVLVSDLIQNSDELSHFQTGPDFDAIESSRFASDKPKLEGVEITVRVVPRRNYAFPKAKLVEFWRQLFLFSGAEDAEIL